MISEVLKAYSFVQEIMNEKFEQGVNPSTKDIQQAYFEEYFNPDSKKQESVICKCIERGRTKALQLLINYFEKDGEGGLMSDWHYLKYYEPEKGKAEMKTEGFKSFMEYVHSGGFSKDENEIIEALPDYPELAILFNRKVIEIAKGGHNIVISTGRGSKSTWVRATLWAWYIRDFKEYQKSFQRLVTQLKRGIATKLRLPTGESLEKVLEYTTPIKAALSDGTAWKCPNCGVQNVAENKKCVICGSPQSKT